MRVGVYLRNRCDNKRLHACPGVVTLLFAKPRINDVNNPIYGQRSFGDIGCQDDLREANKIC
jgi:hypothetical protein